MRKIEKINYWVVPGLLTGNPDVDKVIEIWRYFGVNYDDLQQLKHRSSQKMAWLKFLSWYLYEKGWTYHRIGYVVNRSHCNVLFHRSTFEQDYRSNYGGIREIVQKYLKENDFEMLKKLHKSKEKSIFEF